MRVLIVGCGYTGQRVLRMLGDRGDSAVGLRRSTEALLPNHAGDALRAFRWLENPAGHFWADPFLIERGGQTWLFVEDFDRANGKGTIQVTPVADDGQIDGMRTALERPYHLSYPNVFEHAGEVFMMPETLGSGAVELYRARNFPDDWVLESRLLNLRCVDATPFERDGRWWMFLSPMPVLGHAPITLLYSADSLTSQWRLHPASPIANDVRSARSAGQVFEQDGRWYRPAMDCAVRYGRALVLHEILRMDEQVYEERQVTALESSWAPSLIGVHTYNRAGAWETIDGLFPTSRARAE